MAWPDSGTNEVTKSIGTASRDYASIISWEGDTDENCTTGWGAGDYAAACSPVGDCYDDADFTGNTYLTGATTDSTHYRRLTVHAGERHDGTNASGAVHTSGYFLWEDDAGGAGYWVSEWLILDSGNLFGVKGPYNMAGGGAMMRLHVVTTDTLRAGGSSSADTRLENCIAHTVSKYAFRYFDTTQNCSAFVSYSYGIGNTECTNCIVCGASAQCFFSCTGDYNIGSDTTAPGANSIDNVAAADIFADTGSPPDLHLLDGSTDADNAGDDLSASFTIDIDGDTRSDWDIGADEVVSAAGYTLTAAAGSFTLTGNAADLRADRTLPGGVGSFALTGQDADLLADRKLAAGAGAFTLTGKDADLLKAKVLTAERGTFVYTGKSVALHRGLVLPAAKGAFSVSMQNVDLITDSRVPLTIHINPLVAASRYADWGFASHAAFRSAFYKEVRDSGFSFVTISCSSAYLAAEIAAARAEGVRLFVHLYWTPAPRPLGYGSGHISAYRPSPYYNQPDDGEPCDDTAMAEYLNANKDVVAGLWLADDMGTDSAADATYRTGVFGDLDSDIGVYTASTTSAAAAYIASMNAPRGLLMPQTYARELGGGGVNEEGLLGYEGMPDEQLAAMNDLIATLIPSDGLWFQCFGWFGTGHPSRWNGSTYVQGYHTACTYDELMGQLVNAYNQGLRGPFGAYAGIEESTAQLTGHQATEDGGDDYWCGVWDTAILRAGGSLASARHYPTWDALVAFNRLYGLGASDARRWQTTWDDGRRR